MAHDIYRDDATGNYSFAWAAGGAVPWHKLGQVVPEGSSRDTWISLAGYGWGIQQAPVEYQARVSGQDEPVVAQSSQHLVNYRSDTGAPLGIVSPGYRPVQPQEIFDTLWGWAEAGGLTPETAGVLRGGRRFFVLARNGGSLEIGQGDKTQSYCLLATSADGTLATRAQWTAVRVVCANTLAVATGSGRGAAEYRCTHRTTWDPDAADKALGIVQARQDWEVFAARMTALADRPVSSADVTDYYSDLLRPPKQDASRILDLTQAREPEKVRAIRGLQDLEASYRSAPGAAPGTWYGAVQGLTHYVDHVRGTDTGNRLDSALFAQGAALKLRGFEEACTRAGVH